MQQQGGVYYLQQKLCLMNMARAFLVNVLLYRDLGMLVLGLLDL